ncbi:transposase [Methanoculleus sp. FWC-SCC1]|uniref:Transposase n=1 Tax=Methanoculleus frigidifontis TaxID=2584085 RepID=A0ABT8MC07_9EURY|nr:transposase [Methanoculleus sp. FWC-SCC1]MDN7025465.1 transposase [Methanoculleus sp. FWC-SCC1]
MVRPSRISDRDYINFLVAAQCDVSCVKAAECFCKDGFVVTHDTFNRFLTRQSLPPETLWEEVEPFIEKRTGWLIVDDTVLDKVHSEKMALTYYQWSGNQHQVIKGIGLVTLVWTDGEHTYPVDYRIYDFDTDHLTKNDHLRAMLKTAAARGFQPAFVLFDSWYSGIDNLKCLDRLGWQWFTRIKKNRMVNPDDTENRPVETLEVPDDGMVVHMKKYGFVKVFHTVNKTGKDQYWATNCLTMDLTDRRNLQAICWSIENFHRALKELCCVEDCKIRKEAGQRNHINCSLRAYIRLEAVQQRQDITIYQAKWDIVKTAITEYVHDPKYAL